MSIFNSINISATALTAEKTRIDIIAKNISFALCFWFGFGDEYNHYFDMFELF